MNVDTPPTCKFITSSGRTCNNEVKPRYYTYGTRYSKYCTRHEAWGAKQEKKEQEQKLLEDKKECYRFAWDLYNRILVFSNNDEKEIALVLFESSLSAPLMCASYERIGKGILTIKELRTLYEPD